MLALAIFMVLTEFLAVVLFFVVAVVVIVVIWFLLLLSLLSKALDPLKCYPTKFPTSIQYDI